MKRYYDNGILCRAGCKRISPRSLIWRQSSVPRATGTLMAILKIGLPTVLDAWKMRKGYLPGLIWLESLDPRSIRISQHVVLQRRQRAKKRVLRFKNDFGSNGT